jgi:TldD protein
VTYNVVTGLDDTARETAARADALLRAPKCEGGAHTVILNPDMAGVFVHEAFGHLSEGDFLYENAKMRELMHPGRVVGGPELNVVDDGSIPGRAGSQAVDDEGTPTGKTYLIREGALAGHLHSLETAAKMDGVPTGNARAIGRDVPPIVRMTNTYIEAGHVPVDKLFAGVDRGIYACDSFGGQTALEMFTFSAAYGYRIENGKKGELVRDVTLTGNVFETLKSIDGIADDFAICERGGGCGKGNQSPLPVTVGSPHVRIRNVVIGGG